MREPVRCGVQLASGWYEYRSDFARRHFIDGWNQRRLEVALEMGRLEGALEVARDILLAIAGRHGPVPDGIQARVAACDDLARLRALTLELADDVDEPAVEALLAALAAAG